LRGRGKGVEAGIRGGAWTLAPVLFFLFYFIGSNGVHMPGLARACGRGETLFLGEPRIRRRPPVSENLPTSVEPSLSGELPPSVEGRELPCPFSSGPSPRAGAEIIALIPRGEGFGQLEECPGGARHFYPSRGLEKKEQREPAPLLNWGNDFPWAAGIGAMIWEVRPGPGRLGVGPGGGCMLFRREVFWWFLRHFRPGTHHPHPPPHSSGGGGGGSRFFWGEISGPSVGIGAMIAEERSGGGGLGR